MLRLFAAVLAMAVISTSSETSACPGCAGDMRSRTTLRMQFAQAKVVVHGQLKNPRFNPKTDEGFTDLHIDTVLKDDPARNGQAVLTLRSYIPVVANTPSDFLVFCNIVDGKLDAFAGIPSSPAVVEYLKAAAKLDDKDPSSKFGFYFKHLDSAEPNIAVDAFYEFARAPEAEIVKAARQFDAARIRKWMTSPAIPSDRVGVLAFLLGVAGGPADAQFLLGMLKENPLSERTSTAFGGILVGYLLLNPREGWQLAASILGDEKQSLSTRLSTLGIVRYLQSSRGNDCKAEVLRCCAALLTHGDFADQAIEDLRRWGYWDLTNDILAQFPKPTHSAAIVQRSIVRYALCCPDNDSKRFVAALRQSDPKLVQKVEEQLDLYAPIAPLPKKNP